MMECARATSVCWESNDCSDEPGNVWLRSLLSEVAWASTKTGTSYFSTQSHRIARRRGRNKAVMALAHSCS
jgi:hypothetical protein